MIRPQLILDLFDEIIVDLFAGGGGVSTAIEQATGRHVDLAVNHDPDAIAMHRANHPQTEHFTADIWEIDPRVVTRGRPVGLLHGSPDCTDHSQASAGQPRDVQIRSLPWVLLRWAGTVRPRVITLENVKQMRSKWGPLIAKRCKETGRVVKRDGSVAAPGEVVPVRDQHLIADPKRSGKTWRRFVRRFAELGYVGNDTDLVAAEYGAPTSRERLFGIFRCDGGPVSFPEPSHFKKPGKGQKRMREAWECIDFTLPCPSVLMTKAEAKELGLRVQRPLADKTCFRLAKGTERFVMQAEEPFIVCVTHAGGDRVQSLRASFPTITGANRGEWAIGMPFIAGVGGRAGQSQPRSVFDQWNTLTTKADQVAAMPFLAFQQQKGGVRGAIDQFHTITASQKDQNQVCACYVARDFNTTIGHAMTDPTLSTMANGGGGRNQFVAHFLAQNNEGMVGHPATDSVSTIATKGGNQSLGACRLAACTLVKYYRTSAPEILNPLDVITTRDRFSISMAALDVPPLTPWMAERARQLAVWLRRYGVDVPGEFAMCGPFVIWDLGMRMFKARELFRAQGFPEDYIIDYGIDAEGKRVEFTEGQKIHMCGNSVSPPPYTALVRHIVPELCAYFDNERRVA